MAISVFDLFKIGIGPSSSHTVGPMRAAALFTAALRQRQALSAVRRLEVRLYGSLSATGVGHGTDRAVIMGLMGEWPDRIDPTQIAPRMAALLDSGLLQLDGRVAVPFDWVRDMRLLDENLPYHPNAMTLVAYGEQGELHQETYYSVGGGFVVDAAQAASGQLDQDHTVLPYDFSSAEELLLLCKRHNLRVSELMLANERIWRSETDIREGLRRIWQAMRDCVDNGLRNEGILPGGLNVQRRAARLHRNLQEIGKPNVIGSTLSAMEWVNLFALAVNEARVQVSQQVLDGLKRQTRTFTYLLAGLGIISLLGGGVGVMNVMLMSVAERRREIGVRMALGARQRDIRNLFLIEAVTLTAAGALSGAVLGVAAAYLYARFSGWTFSLAYAALPLGMGSTLLVGLFFGLYPAVSAARLQPVEALRDE